MIFDANYNIPLVTLNLTIQRTILSHIIPLDPHIPSYSHCMDRLCGTWAAYLSKHLWLILIDLPSIFIHFWCWNPDDPQMIQMVIVAEQLVARLPSEFPWTAPIFARRFSDALAGRWAEHRQLNVQPETCQRGACRFNQCNLSLAMDCAFRSGAQASV